MSRGRALHLINGEYFGGSARVLTNYVEAAAREWDVAVAVFFPGELERRLRAMGVPVEVLSMRSRVDLRPVRDAVRLARRHHASLVHTHQVRNTLIGRIAARVDRRPVVTHVHSPAFRESTGSVRNLLTGGIDRVLGGWSDRFVAVSASLADELARLRVPAERIRVVRNGIPMPDLPDPAAREAARRELGADDAELLVGMVANFRPRKGTEILIAAVAALAADGVRVRLALVGEPFREGGRDYGAELRGAAADAGIGDRVVFTGFREDVGRLIGAFDAFVLPSLFGEGLPMVLLEAMGTGVPVVSTPVEGIVELVEAEANGLLVPLGEPEPLAAALRRLAADEGLRRRLGAAGRDTIASSFTSDRMAAELESVYAELVGS